MNVEQMNIVNRPQPVEPWWIKEEREMLEQMRKAIKGKAETAMVRYCGDMRPVPVYEVRKLIEDRQARILRDVAKFIEVGGDYEQM